ncbi:MAG: hypothetical protein K2J85_02025, partial [Anaeroplasmataceae bacterium]|nr:hypothetical protein [Anaeroplasmataceae bacterium]
IIEGYQSMISYFGDIQIGNSNLSSLYRNIEAFSSNDSIKEYEYLAYQNYYMTKEEFETSLKEKEALLTEQGLLRERKKVLLESLKNIYTNSNGNTYMDTAIANYLNSLHTLDTRLMSIDESLKLIEGASLGEYNEQESEAFLKTLDEYKTELEKYTEEYTNSVGDVLKETTLMNLHSLQVKGKIGVFLAIPASILMGIISGLGIAFLVAFIESNKKKEESK